MSTLPDRKRQVRTPPARALAASLLHHAAASAWRVLHPAEREPFVESARPEPLRRVYYESADGWRAPLRHVPGCPGGSGEPVLVAHALGQGVDALRYGEGEHLVGALSAAGFSVYLWEHRGDPGAIPPEARTRVDVDAVATQDLPAALAAAAADAGFPRAMLVGHALGGQIALIGGAKEAAAVVAIAAPARFARTPSGFVEGGRALALLPSHWRLPSRALSRAMLPWVEPAALAASAPPARVRGALRYASEDVAAGLLAQIERWFAAGTLTDRTGNLDYVEAMREAEAPLLAIAAGDDAVAGLWACAPAVAAWGAERALIEVPGAALDLLLGRHAHERVFAPITAFLAGHRRRCWEEPERVRLAG